MRISKKCSTDKSTCFVVTTSLPLTAAPLATGVRARANLGGNEWSPGESGGYMLAEAEGDGCDIANHQTKQ